MTESLSRTKFLSVSYDEDRMASDDHSDVDPSHVETPKRLSSILSRLRKAKICLESGENSNLFDHLQYVKCERLSREILLLCHTEEYLDEVLYWSKESHIINSELKNNKFVAQKRKVLFPLDVETYITPHSELVSNLAVSALIELCNIIMESTLESGQKNHSKLNTGQSDLTKNGLNSDQNFHYTRKGFALVRPPGHHATPDRMMGFCIFNNVAVAAKYLQHKFGLKRIAIIDWDVHQGNGTQDIFYDDDSVLFISLHRYGVDDDSFWPYFGYCDELGVGKGYKYNVNVPLEKEFTNADLVHSFNRVVIPVVERFEPEFLIVSAGFDAGKDDLLGGCNLDSEGYAWATKKLCDLTEKYCKGRLLFSLEGGYTLHRLSEDVESVVTTMVKYEYANKFNLSDDSKTADFKELTDEGVFESTIIACNKLVKLLDLYDLTKDLEDLSISNKLPTQSSKISTFTSFDNKDCDEQDTSFYKYQFELDKNTFIIAGGHQNQWILPENGSNEQIIKLCSKKEIDFFNWIYKKNGKTLKMFVQPVEEPKLQFTNGLQTTIRTGIRLTNPTKEITNVSSSNTISPVDNPVRYECKDKENGWENSLKFIDYLSECSALFEPYVFEDWKLGKKCAIRLKNALFGMKVPCVMDLKMGTRLYGDDCIDPEEIRLKEIKASSRCCKSHGFHISGIFKWDTVAKSGEYVPQQVVYNARSDQEILDLFTLYLSVISDKEHRRLVLERFLEKLESLRNIFEKQTNLAFYGSSLLFVYDVEKESERDNVFMIDLSHVSYNVQSLDHGYLFGLNSVIRLLKLTKDQIS